MLAWGPENRNTTTPCKDHLLYSHCNTPRHSLESYFKANPHLPVCSHYRIPGHTKEKGYKLNGFPLGHKNNTKLKASTNQFSLAQEGAHHGSPITQDQYDHLLAILNTSNNNVATPVANSVQTSLSHVSGIVSCNSAHTHRCKIENTIAWILDIGAIDHMVCSLDFFTHNNTSVSHSIKLPIGATTIATHIGCLPFQTRNSKKSTMYSSIFF